MSAETLQAIEDKFDHPKAFDFAVDGPIGAPEFVIKCQAAVEAQGYRTVSIVLAPWESDLTHLNELLNSLRGRPKLEVTRRTGYLGHLWNVEVYVDDAVPKRIRLIGVKR